MQAENDEDKTQWLNADQLSEKVIKELTTDIIVNECTQEILNEKEISKALSKALLALIYLTQEEAGEALNKYIRFLLFEFPALAAQFNSENQVEFLNRDFGTLLRFHNNKRYTLLAREELFIEQFRELESRLKEIAAEGGTS